MTTLQEFGKAFSQGLELAPVLTVSEWADEFRTLTSKDSNERGRFRTDRAPFIREIQDSLGPDCPVSDVAVMKAAQAYCSTLGINWVGHTITDDPCPMMIVQPDIPRAKLFSIQRLEDLFDPMVTPHVASRCTSTDSKDSVLVKTYNSGVMQLIGANSAAGFRQMPYKKLYADEVDAWPLSLGRDGSPIGLARRGMTTYEGNRKAFWISTPLLEGESAIHDLFMAGDQRYWNVPCLKCGTFQVLKFEQLRARRKEKGGTIEFGIYECEKCSHGHRDKDKAAMHAEGVWIPTRPEITDFRSYQVSALMTSFGLGKTWGRILANEEDSKDDPKKMQVFYNHDLGIPYPVGTEVPDWERLYLQREAYPLEVVPEGACVLSAGVDFQLDRAEMEVVAWGPNNESWSVAYYVFQGNINGPVAFEAIMDRLATPFKTESGHSLLIAKCALDTGWSTQIVYPWIRRMQETQVMAIKGTEGDANLVRPPRTVDIIDGGKKRGGLLLWPVGTWTAKAELYARLLIKPPTAPGEPYPPGFCHFPEYDQKHFQQLTGEQMVRIVSGNSIKYGWKPIPGRRNEQLDCRVYARAAAHLYGIDRWTAERWTEEAFNIRNVDVEDKWESRKRPRDQRGRR